MTPGAADPLLLICPYSGVNTDTPDLNVAYAATKFGAKVVDFNTKPEPMDRHLDLATDTLGISVRSPNATEAKRLAEAYQGRHPHAAVKSVTGFLDVQCCYPYLALDESIQFDEPFSDAYPFPNFELWDSFDLFRKRWADGAWPYAIMTSQGCPFRCTYCASRLRKWRPRSPRNCREELAQAQQRWGIKRFVVLDDCFNVDAERVLELCEEVAPLGLSWFCGNGLRADRFDETMAESLARAGCDAISFGIESTDPDVLLAIEKGETIEQIEAAVLSAGKHFKFVNGFFIIGLPGSTFETDLASFGWAQRMGIRSHFSYYVPSAGGLAADSVFYGEHAEPRSTAYAKEDQRRLYEMTASMRPRQSRPGLWRRLLRRLAGGLLPGRRGDSAAP